MKIILFLFVAIAAISANAADVRTQRAERIALILGVEKLLAEAQKSDEESARAQVQIMLEELRRTGMKDEVIREIEELTEPLIQRVNAAWDPKEAGHIYSEGLVELLSDQELEGAEKYYASPEGKKAYAALSSSQASMLAYISAKTSAVLRSELAAFMGRVRQLGTK